MLRLSRTRRNDPVNEVDPLSRKFGQLHEPPLGLDFGEIKFTLEELRARVPAYDDRRAMIARDALASVDGFRVIMYLALEYLVGIRICDKCPDCNNGENNTPCQDLFGSSATPEGGVFGRADGVCISIEA